MEADHTKAGGPGASVEFRAVTKAFAATSMSLAAVENLSLTVGPGEICVLVGPSGCGKTTSLKMVNRLVEPTKGSVLIDGEDVAHQDVVRLRRGIGYVIQHVGLFPHQTIAENVATVPRLLGWGRDRTRSRVDELLALVGLVPEVVSHRYPAQLSGGERQRVGVARALAAEPSMLLLDEPFGALDANVRQRLQDEFLRIHRRLGMTVLFVTHDIDEAIKMGTRVAVMRRGGHLDQYGSPVEILMQPANEDVAQFVGRDRLLKRLGLLTVGSLATQHEPSEERGWPTFRADATVREILPLLIAQPAYAGVVVDETGNRRGILTLDSVAKCLHAGDPSDPGRDTAP
jgi:osmoprotectant transport system ATP-binding protein